MAYEVAPAAGGQIVGTHLSLNDYSAAGAAQYRFVKQNAAGQIVRCDTLGERAFGVLQNRPAAARSCTIWRSGGVSKMEAGGVVALNDPITTDATGRAIKATVAGQQIMGRAELAAANAGEMISVSLQPEGIV